MQLHSNGGHYFQLFHRYLRSGWAVHCALHRLYQDVLAACQPLGLLPFTLSHAPVFGCETPPREEGRRSMVEFPCWQQWVTLPQRSPGNSLAETMDDYYLLEGVSGATGNASWGYYIPNRVTSKKG